MCGLEAMHPGFSFVRRSNFSSYICPVIGDSSDFSICIHFQSIFISERYVYKKNFYFKDVLFERKVLEKGRDQKAEGMGIIIKHPIQTR